MLHNETRKLLIQGFKVSDLCFWMKADAIRIRQGGMPIRLAEAEPLTLQCAFQAVSPSDCLGWFKYCDYLH